MGYYLSWLVTILGLLGFWLAGRKVWWAWYINIANQLVWVAFAVVTDYYAFLLGTAFYLFVFSRNAYLWTRDRNVKPGVYHPFGEVQSVSVRYQQPTEILVKSFGYFTTLAPETKVYYKE